MSAFLNIKLVKMKKILIVFGTRPEAIKMAPLVKELYHHAEFDTKVCVTAQHREMLDQVLAFFSIQPDYDLDLMKANQTLNQLSARILTAIDEVLVSFKPDLVLVHGDTSTSSIVALAAFHLGIKVGHVEAGLRTYNKFAPFPEEINRQITGRLADIHFAPTKQSAQNLLNEGVSPNAVHITGNTVIDALLWGIKHINEDRKDIKEIKQFVDINKKLIVVTGHRRENFGDKFFSLENAKKIGSIRTYIDSLEVSTRMRHALLTSLFYATDKVANTVGHYDAFRRGSEVNNPLVLKFPNFKKKIIQIKNFLTTNASICK